jgi:hypothetical protein
MINTNVLACDIGDQTDQMIYGNHLFRTDIHRSREIGAQQLGGALNAFIDI